MAKGIAGGMPLSAITGRAEIIDLVQAGGLGGTYGGNPVACAAALATIETMKSIDLSGARHDRIGRDAASRRLAEPTSVIGDVRGRGAMLAIELVVPGTDTPDPAITKAVCGAAQAGVSCS